MIDTVEAWEVLDSRGDPTVRVRVGAGDATGTFTVPAGASTGRHEAVERRDGGDRFGGRGVRGAVAAVTDELAPVVEGRDPTDQRVIDEALVAADGTGDLHELGANAVLGVSGAVAHLAAAKRGVPLYRSLAEGAPGRLPLPRVNVVSGGLHAAGGIEIQDFMVVPRGATSYPEALETAWAVREAVRQRVLDRGERPLVADEGGFSPDLAAPEAAFELLAAATRDAGHRPARDDVAVAVDMAATHFYDGERYRLESRGERRSTGEMVDLLAEWIDEWPVVSVEDPLAEDDWAGWRALAERVGDEVRVLGDDLLVTDVDRIERAARTGAADAALIKPNQAGTLTRAVDAVRAAERGGLVPVVSARSGETCDTTIADLAVALDAGHIKVGSLARSERLAKYNRLLAVARDVDGFAGGSRADRGDG